MASSRRMDVVSCRSFDCGVCTGCRARARAPKREGLTDFAIIAVRLWHHVAAWEPGLCGVTDSWRSPGLPAFQIWYAPKPWGGRGLSLCALLPFHELRKRLRPATPTRQADMFGGDGAAAKPELLCSTKVLTARPEIPPFIDSDCWGRMQAQVDWYLEGGLVPSTTSEHDDQCMGRGGWKTEADRDAVEKKARYVFGIKGATKFEWPNRDRFCDCGHEDQHHRDPGFKLVTFWREAELRADIASLKPGWAEGLLADPRKVTLAGRSSHKKRSTRPEVVGAPRWRPA